MTILASDELVEFEIRVRGQRVASVIGPYLSAMAEAMHYGMVYAADEGDENVTIKRRISRRKPNPKEKPDAR